MFTAPTSAGKSAVAEILMLRRLCEFKDKVCRTVLTWDRLMDSLAFGMYRVHSTA